MTRKTKRNSPPPQHTTINTLGYTQDFSANKFSEKMSKVLQLVTPPNKKRRAIALIGQSQTYEEESDNSSSDEELDEQLLLKQKKQLNRRAMYIENPPTMEVQKIDDGPQGTRHTWTMYCKTLDKLSRNSLPLSENMQLRKMLAKLQQNESIQQRILLIQKEQQKRLVSQLDDDDDTPLGTLFNAPHKRISPPFYQLQPPPLCYQPRWITYNYYPKQPLPLFHLSTVHTF